MRPPIIVDARGDLLVFTSVAAAQMELAPEDVRNGEYPVAYDSEGRLLRIEVRTRERRILGVFRETTEYVHIGSCEHIATHDRDLRALLLRFIAPRDAQTAGSNDPLAGLLTLKSGRPRAG